MGTPRKYILLIVGWFLLVVGLVITPLPWPFGFGAPMAITGLVLLLSHSFWVRRRFIKLTRTYPISLGWIKGFLRKTLPGLRKRFGINAPRRRKASSMSSGKKDS
ncbi:MAG: hypothetical protein EBT20_11590 [Alphaproteobacteria bacterium]|nr:hypothetical protein [Alphaproteobacteria bacterium]